MFFATVLSVMSSADSCMLTFARLLHACPRAESDRRGTTLSPDPHAAPAAAADLRRAPRRGRDVAPPRARARRTRRTAPRRAAPAAARTAALPPAAAPPAAGADRRRPPPRRRRPAVALRLVEAADRVVRDADPEHVVRDPAVVVVVGPHARHAALGHLHDLVLREPPPLGHLNRRDDRVVRAGAGRDVEQRAPTRAGRGTPSDAGRGTTSACCS